MRAPSRVREFTAALILFVTFVTFASAQIPPGIAWPTRYAVGVLDHTDQMPPTTIEATSDGWVILNFQPSRPDEGLAPPSMRLMAQPHEVRRWVARVRDLLAPASDTITNAAARELPPLGSGNYLIRVKVSPTSQPGGMYFGVLPCGTGAWGTTPSRDELARFLALLDSAALRAGGESRRPANFRRPYYASEVSCPAVSEAGTNTPQFPRNIPAAERRRTEIGVRFIVDTSGAIERRSIEFLPGTNARFGAAARRDMRLWRYRRAERDGIPVRQIVQTKLVFEPGGAVYRPPHTITLSATDDGWVHFRHASSFPAQLPIQEWFSPDSVDAWVRRVRALNAEAARLARTASRDTEKATSLGSPLGIRFGAGYFAYEGDVQLRAGLTACSDAYTEGERPIDAAFLAELSAVARDARSRRTPPSSPSALVFVADEVACPAWLPWSRDTSDATTRLWRYPTGVYPSTMARENARAEVLVSFIVDAAGVPKLTTLQVIGGADPRAVAALPATLSAFRFRPATRGGRQVAQRVIQTILFEPLPVRARSRE